MFMLLIINYDFDDDEDDDSDDDKVDDDDGNDFVVDDDVHLYLCIFLSNSSWNAACKKCLSSSS